MSLEAGCARDQHEGEQAVISPAGGHRTTLLRGMEDGMRPGSIRASAVLAGWDLSSQSCLWRALAEAPAAQPWEVQGGLASRDRIKEFWVSLGWEPGRLFLALGGRVLLIYLSSYFWKGVGLRGFFWLGGGLSSSKG